MYSAPESGFADLSRAINPDYLRDEEALVRELAQQATVEPQLQGAIARTGYGLTLGIHSRIENRALAIAGKVTVGNVYINRNMVGAMVGVQPFGGLGLSGTGPKAGGPNYLPRFTAEQTITINTAAVGGNASLLTLDDD